MINFEAELDRLAADLAIFDVACGAGTGVHWRLEALPTIWTLDQVKLHAARGADVRGYAGLDHWLETVHRINALRIAWLHVGLGWLLAGNGPLHGLTIPQHYMLVNARNRSRPEFDRSGGRRPRPDVGKPEIPAGERKFQDCAHGLVLK